MLERITPVLLTFNEEPNIARTLAALEWARDIVVVDSGSTDATLDILAAHPKVRVFSRAFDTHGGQWRFAVTGTDIRTDWILRLDADYQVTAELAAEMATLDLARSLNAYRIGFDYAVVGHRLRASLYPANTVLLRKGHFTVTDHGHTEIWSVRGAEGALRARLVHDDRKSVRSWMAAQGRYMEKEADRIIAAPRGLKDWLRLHPPLAPLCAFFYCLVVKGLMFDGRAGLFYALQRVVAETALSLVLLERRLKS